MNWEKLVSNEPVLVLISVMCPFRLAVYVPNVSNFVLTIEDDKTIFEAEVINEPVTDANVEFLISKLAV